MIRSVHLISSTAAMLVAIVLPLSAANINSNRSYLATVEAFDCNVPVTATHWRPSPPGEGMSIRNDRFTDDEPAYTLQTTTTGTQPSEAAGFQITVTYINRRSGENTDFRDLDLLFTPLSGGISFDDLVIVGYPQGNSPPITRTFSQLDVRKGRRNDHLLIATNSDFGFPRNVFVRKWVIYQRNNSTGVQRRVDWGAWQIRFGTGRSPIYTNSRTDIYFDNIGCVLN